MPPGGPPPSSSGPDVQLCRQLQLAVHHYLHLQGLRTGRSHQRPGIHPAQGAEPMEVGQLCGAEQTQVDVR